jgi:hypothetical protein
MAIPSWFLLWMRIFSNKSCRENQNVRFTFGDFFPKIVPVMSSCQKMWWSQRGYKWRYNMAHTRCMLDKQDNTHARTCTRPSARASTLKRLDRYTRRQLSNAYWFSTATMTREPTQCYVIRTLPVLFIFCVVAGYLSSALACWIQLDCQFMQIDLVSCRTEFFEATNTEWDSITVENRSH